MPVHNFFFQLSMYQVSDYHVTHHYFVFKSSICICDFDLISS